MNDRREYIPRSEILADVERVLSAHQEGDIDWITFVGSGEPTLHLGIGWLIREVKKLSELPVAVITNGALLHSTDVRQALCAADAVLPSLDAGTPHLYRKINRPHPEVPFDKFLDGLVAFSDAYRGKLWVEVMLVQGLNDTMDALNDIAVALLKIQPDEVHINFPTRPPVETWVQPPDEEGLLRARAVLGNTARIVYPASGDFDLSGYDTLADAVIGIVTRHPMRESEIMKTLERWSSEDVGTVLKTLRDSGLIQIVERYGTRFWSTTPGRYPEEKQSRLTKPGFRRKD
jgi:wyosine [tRNA(Phe)-imidazoG37] synthetase (radical SAM superfamily)